MLNKLHLSSQNKLLAGAFIVFLILFFSLNHKNTKVTESESFSADTLIPKGYVLVPIELANLNAVAGLINQYGVIDLYGGHNQEDAVQIATRIKILRAPLNPNQYAVLVSEELSKQIMRYKGPFWASIQNRMAEPVSSNLSHASDKIETTPIIPAKVAETKAARVNSFKNIEIEYYKKEED